MPKAVHWEPVDEEKQIWVAKYRIPSFIARSVAFLSKNKKVILLGAGAPMEDAFPFEPSQYGEPQLALIQNSYHYLGLKKCQKECPGLRAFASPQAIPRLKRKGCRDIQALADLSKELPDNIKVLQPEGMGYGEVWLRVQTGEAIMWIVCDAFFNYARYSNKPIARTLQKCLKAAPGLKISSIAKYFLIKNRKQYKAWLLKQLDQDRPTTLVMAHGEILRSPDLPSQIKALIESRL